MQRKFFLPAAAVSAARVAAHAIPGLEVAEVRPVPQADGWGAILRLYHEPDELSRRDRERLAAFQVEHVAKPEPVEDEDEEDEADDDFDPQVRAKSGPKSCRRRVYALLDNDPTLTNLDVAEAIGVSEQTAQKHASAWRQKQPVDKVYRPKASPIGKTEIKVPPPWL